MKTLLVTVLFAVASIAFAGQGKVVTVKGSATVQKGGNGSWVALKKGYTIKKNDMIKIEKGTKITFSNDKGMPVEMRKAGQYSGAKLFAVTRKKGSASKKFGKFLMDELSETDDLLASGDHKKRMSTLGAVERALPTGEDNKFDVVFPRNTFLIEPTVELVWNTVDGASSYTVSIKDNNGFEVKTLSAGNHNSVSLDLSGITPVRGECYFWSVSSDNGKNTDEYCLLVTDEETIQSINSDLSAIDDEYSADNPVNSYIKARVYEENNMMVEADRHYRNAIELSQNDERFVIIYNNYLDRATN